AGEAAVVGADYTSVAGLYEAGAAPLYRVAPAASGFRNAGSNPGSYPAGAPGPRRRVPAQGGPAASRRLLAALFGFDSPASITLGGGQVLLCADGGGSGELLGLPIAPGPLATFAFLVPNDLALCGLALSTQALQFAGPIPFALSNACDLV